MLLTTVICTAGFWILKNPYYILAGISLGVLDALPVFGTGTVLIPWAVIRFFQGKWGAGILMLAIYLACYFLRELLEAKLMGSRVGLSQTVSIGNCACSFWKSSWASLARLQIISVSGISIS